MPPYPDPDDDPPWFTASTFITVLVPTLAIRRAQDGRSSPLEGLRLVFTSFAVAIVLIGVVVLVLAAGGSESETNPPTTAVAAGVAVFGLLTLLAPRLLVQPLDCSSDGVLVGSYRTRFFLCTAFANAASLVGFVGFFLTGQPWIYLIGVPFTVVGMVRTMPSRRNIVRDAETIATAGCGRDLLRLLARPMTDQ